MCKVYGYCRISTAKQSIERQVRNILASYPDADIRKEVYTGTHFQGRAELQKILDRVQAGDTIVFDSVSRMSRDAEEGIDLYFDLYDKGIHLVFLKERHIDTESYTKAIESTGIKIDNTEDTAEGTLVKDLLEAINKFMRTKASDDIAKAFEQAEKEVADLHQRTKEGIQTARLNGKLVGGAANKGKAYNVKKAESSIDLIRKHSKTFGGTLTNKELMKMCGISEPTLLKYKNEIKIQIQAEQMHNGFPSMPYEQIYQTLKNEQRNQ